MKTISRTLVLCATITAMHNTSAYSAPESVKKYPVIEQHAPDTIKKVCLNEPACALCDNIEKIFWCAQKLANTNVSDTSSTFKFTKNEAERLQYCMSCFEDGLLKKVASIIDEIAQRAQLNNDQAFALLTEFNNTLQSLEQKAQSRPHED